MYIYKGQRTSSGRYIYTTAEVIKVTEVEAVRATGRHIAGFQEVTGTGQARGDVLRISSDKESGKRGGGQRGSFSNHVKRSAAGIKTRLRRVRPEELARIEEFDKQIEAAEEVVRQLRIQRREVVTEAWSKAHVVTLKEIEAQVVGKY